jgi:hypothetical protein
VYLAVTETAPPPEGMASGDRVLAAVAGEPMIVRAFLRGSGHRAVAWGRPEGVNLAFDIERPGFALAWVGALYHERGPLAMRGAESDSASRPEWEAPHGPEFVLDDPPLIGWALDERGGRFVGYDAADVAVPVFTTEYERDRRSARVEQQFLVERGAGVVRLVRRVTVVSTDVSLVYFNAGAGVDVAMISGGAATGDSRYDGLVAIPLTGGRAEFTCTVEFDAVDD